MSRDIAALIQSAKVKLSVAEWEAVIAHLAPAQPASVTPTTFGQAVTMLRTSRGLSRTALAQESGVSYPYLCEIEKDRKVPSARIRHFLEGVLDADLRPYL